MRMADGRQERGWLWVGGVGWGGEGGGEER